MSASMDNLMLKVVNEFSSCTGKPDDYLSLQEKFSSKLREITKNVYDLCKNCEIRKQISDNSLPELLTKDFDEEQIWQQIELQNDNSVSKLLSTISNIITSKESLSFTTSKTNHTEKGKVHQQEETDEDLNDETDGDDTDDEINKIKSRITKETDYLDDDSDNSLPEDDDDFDLPQMSKRGGNYDPATGDINEDESDEEEEDDDDTEFVDKKNERKSKSKRKQTSVVDDKFFKLADMEAFLVQEDAKEAKRLQDADDESESSSSEDLDMFDEVPSDDDNDDMVEKRGRSLRYDDFFDPPDDDTDAGLEKTGKKGKKKVQFQAPDENPSDDDDDADDDKEMDEEEDESDEDRDEEEEDGGNSRSAKRQGLLDPSDSEGEDVGDILGGKKREVKSSYERQQEKLQQKISKMEEASLAEKPWQLSGEIMATQRPENSLLEEHLMYDQSVKLPPVITEETTQSLETIIKQRIKDKAFDDVERKVKPKEEAFEYKKRIVLDQEKSKQSLGEIYEKEYLKQQQEEAEETTDPQHEEIKSMMQSLFVKLDALSNFHYTPKPAAPEIKIVNNLPSIAMEEVAPVTHGDGTLLAPEEIKEKVKGELKGATEKSVQDRKKERRIKKSEKRKRRKEREKRQKIVEKMNPGLGNKYSKEKALKELEKSSKMGKGVTMVKDDKKVKEKNLTSSKSFFTQLQEDVTSNIQKKKSVKRKDDKQGNVSVKKLKL